MVKRAVEGPEGGTQKRTQAPVSVDVSVSPALLVSVHGLELPDPYASLPCTFFQPTFLPL